MKLYKNKDWLQQKYIVEKLFMHEIAKLINVHKSIIWYWLNKFKIKRKKQIYEYKEMKDIEKIKNKNIYPSILGRAGELRVASELLLKGFDVSLMLVDGGADLILTNGNRIQVKTARLRETREHHERKDKTRLYYHAYIYSFLFKGWKRDESGKRKQVAHKLENVDFIILWCIDDNYFFIVPIDKIRGKINLSFSRKTQTHWICQYKNNWDLLEK